MKILIKIFAPILMTALVIISASVDYMRASSKEMNYKLAAPLHLDNPDCLPYSPIKDTIFVLGDVFVSVNLDSQIAQVIKRKDTSVSFKISSGNKNIPLGIETSRGIFTIQSKSEKAISKQFENAELFNWLGFNGNIGFHGLKGNGYYNHLGKRPSSHGCIRISREDGESMFKMVRVGTPVIVYKGEPARILAFADSVSLKSSKAELLGSSGKPYKNSMRIRLENLYLGNAYVLNKKKYYFDGVTKMRYAGFDEGENEKIPAKQNLPVVDFEIVKFKSDLTFKFPFKINSIDFKKYISNKDSIDKEIKID